MKNKFIKILIIFLLLICSISCKKRELPYANLSLDDCAMWALSSQDETIHDAVNKHFSPLKLEYSNLFELLGDDQAYVWVKFTFTLPAELKNDELGVVFPYINFADKTTFSCPKLSKFMVVFACFCIIIFIFNHEN